MLSRYKIFRYTYGIFLARPNRIIIFISILFGVLLTLGVFISLFHSPKDYIQSDAVRIMYIHVPAAWMGMMIYAAMLICGLLFLYSKITFFHWLSLAMAPIGAIFTFICLLSGSLWGYLIWDCFWVWDARVTSMLLLFFLYVSYITLANAIKDDYHRSYILSYMSIIGAVNLPIIKFSVNLWTTMHQTSSISLRGITMPMSMILPLLVMFVAFMCYALVLTILRFNIHILNSRRDSHRNIEQKCV